MVEIENFMGFENNEDDIRKDRLEDLVGRWVILGNTGGNVSYVGKLIGKDEQFYYLNPYQDYDYSKGNKKVIIARKENIS